MEFKWVCKTDAWNTSSMKCTLEKPSGTLKLISVPEHTKLADLNQANALVYFRQSVLAHLVNDL